MYFKSKNYTSWNVFCLNIYFGHIIFMLKQEDITNLKKHYESGNVEVLIEESIELLRTNSNSIVLLDILGSAYASLKNYSEASKYYEKALKINPQTIHLYNNLANVYIDEKKHNEAIPLLEKSIELDPKNIESFLQLAHIYREKKDYSSALEVLEQALIIDPNSVAVIFSIGNVMIDLKENDQALDCFTKCLNLDPSHISSLLNISHIYIHREEYDVALDYLNSLLKYDSKHPNALNNYGVCCLKTKKLRDAKSAFLLASEADSANVEVLINLNLVAMEEKDFDAAKKYLEKAIEIDPENKLANLHYANLMMNTGDIEEAIQKLDVIESLDDKDVTVYINLGNVYNGIGQPLKAMEYFKKALDIEPRKPETLLNIGNAFRELKKIKNAISSYRLSLKLKPNYPEAYNNLGVAYCEVQDYEKAVENFDKVLELNSDHHMARAQRAFAAAQLCDWSKFEEDQTHFRNLGDSNFIIPPFALLALDDNPDKQLLRATNYTEMRCPNKRPHEKKSPPKLKPEKIKIGYFSADFVNHATMHLMKKLFSVHDKNLFEIHAFSYDMYGEDATKKQLKSEVDYFHDVRFMSDADVALLAKNQKIDIALDLKGFTLQSRLGIFSYKFAPIQISYLGYPGTLGATFIDYMIADKVVVPQEFRKYYSENIIYLPDSYQVNDDEKKISQNGVKREDFGLKENDFVFCSFNQPYKISLDEFKVWMRILDTVPNSVLWLMDYFELSKQNLRAAAQSSGINPERIIFSKRMDISDHLERHKLGDLFLDTFNVNAHTTTSDALWAGLPVLTLVGKSFSARVSASLLNAVGLPELITNNLNDYQNLAIDLATNKSKLSQIKTRLKNNLDSYPLFNTAQYCKNLEKAYVTVYENYLDGGEPKDFEI